MLVSTKGRYALRVLADMAEHQTDGYVPLKEIARRQGISEKYLESIVKSLVKSGILTGLRGKGGGYRLRRPPEQIKVSEILNLTEGGFSPVACLADDAETCPRMAVCPTLSLWQGLDQVISNYLDSYSVADLMVRENSGGDYVI